MKVPPDAEEFDISLLCVLFRNICPNVPPPTLGWNTRQPDVNDLSLAADLQRLKNIRNSVYAHKSSTKVTNADFEPLWIDLSQIIYRISKHGSGKHQNIKQRIQILRNENLDPRSERDRMLKIFIKWQEQDEEHKKMILQRMDNQDIVQQNNYQLLQDIHQRVVTNSQVGPGICTCRAFIKVPEDEAAVHTPDQVITSNLDSIPADQNWVCLIKMYTWLKEEMTKKTAKCIASQLLGQINEDHVESIELSSRRRMAVDRLLKHVLQRNPSYPAHLKTFLEILECHCESADAFRHNMLNALPTEEETKDCLDRNTNSLNASRCNETFCDQERFKLHETDKQVIHDNIKDITMIDILNNEFLSKFHFSLVEHQRVCDCLYKEHFDDGATCLIEIMEKCSKMVAYCFCDTLKLLEDKCCIVEGLVQDLQLREKYCLTEVNQNETAGHIADENCLFFHMASPQERLKRWCLQTLDFIVTQITHGSIIIHMRPNSEASWRRLEALCSSGQITGLLKTIFEDGNIRKLMPDAENGVLLNIYREADPNTSDAVNRMAILTLELTSEKDKAIQDQNPLILNMDLFSEELEICDELIQLLKEKELIPEYTVERLKETTSRSSEIRCLLHLISSPEKGYEAIKEYLISADKYLHGQLVKREENRTQRKLIYTDRQKIPAKEFNESSAPDLQYSPEGVNVAVIREGDVDVRPSVTGHQSNPVHEFRPDIPGDGVGNDGGLSDREIDRISRQIGTEWERLGIFLDYEAGQINALKRIYRDQLVTRSARMIQRWRDVVVSCGESPRILLAAAFASIQRNDMAESLVPTVEVIKDKEARRETKDKIRLINPDIQGSSSIPRKSPVTAIGGEGGINVFDGDVTLGSLSSHPSASLSIQTLPVSGMSQDFNRLEPVQKPEITGQFKNVHIGEDSNILHKTEATIGNAMPYRFCILSEGNIGVISNAIVAILDQLEREQIDGNFVKGYWHERDAVAGTPIIENITNSIQNSKFVLLLIHPVNIRHEWWKMMNISLIHRMINPEHMNTVIPIFIDDPEDPLATRDIPLEIQALRGLRYDSNSDAEFWRKLKNLILGREEGKIIV